MIGEFNEILSSEDKFGGNQINLNRALEFKECIDNCNFLDLGFASPKYTWTNKRPITSLILEMLDVLPTLARECYTLKLMLLIFQGLSWTIVLF